MSDRKLNSLAELVKVRLREFWREKGTLFWVFGFPLLMTMGLGLAFRSRPPERPRIAVVAPPENGLAAALLTSSRLVAVSAPADVAQRDLARAKADLVVTLGATPPAYLFDATQEKSLIARAIVDDVLQRAAGRKDVLSVSEVNSMRRGSRYVDFLIPGLIGLNLMGSSMWGVGYNLVLARKRKVLRRLAVTPMRRSEFLLSYFFSRSILLVVELAVLLTFGALCFGSVVRGGYLALAAVAFLGAASFAGVSLLIGARVETTEAANGWMNLVQLPMWVLSGAFFSYERFPGWLHAPIRLLPLTALVDALRGVFNDGLGLFDLRSQILVLLVWGGVGFGVALRTFRWQ